MSKLLSMSEAIEGYVPDGSTVALNNGHSYVLQEEYSDRAGGCAYR